MRKKISVKEITYIGLFSALMIICSWINVPFVVPFTLQTFGIFLMVFVMGIKKSLISMAIYYLLGICGVPVFAGFKSGVSSLLGPTGGYLIGFIFMIIITGAIKNVGKGRAVKFLSGIVGLLFCYAFGTIWFYYVYLQKGETQSLFAIMLTCVVPYLLPDAVKLWLAILLEGKLKKHIKD